MADTFFMRPSAAGFDVDRSEYGSFWFQPVAFTAGGANVTPDAALRLSAAFRCVSLVSGHMAMLPLRFFKSGTRKQVDHPLAKLFNRRPNRWQNAYEWREMMQAHLELRGNAYNQIESNPRTGEITALVPMHPDRIKIIPTEDGQDWFYRCTRVNGTIFDLARGEVWHLRGLSSDGVRGMSVVDYARESIGAGLAVQSYGARFFANDAKPTSGWVSVKGQFKDKPAREAFREQMHQAQGDFNRGRMMVLDQGMEYHEVGLTNEAAQFLETRQFHVNDIARWFGIPPHKIGDLARCMPADTLVFTESGPKRIVDVKPGDMVWSVTESRSLVLSKVLNFWDNGVDEILEFQTTNRTVRCNPKHRLMVRRPYERDLLPGEIGGKNVNGKKVRVEWREEYVQASELRVGDTLVTLKKTPDCGATVAPNGRNLTVGFMEFCGLLVGDGNVLDGTGSVTIARSDKATYIEHYRNVMREEFKKADREYAFGEDHTMAKLSSGQVAEIKELGKRIESASGIARRFGADISTVCAIGRGRKYDCKHPQAGISEELLVEIKSALENRLTSADIAERYGVERSTITNILSGRSWTSKGTRTVGEEVLVRDGYNCSKFSSVAACDELKELGFSGTAFTKSIPDWVFGLSEELRLAFLRGIVDSDGTIDNKGRITIAMVNKLLIEQIRHLCMSCDVPVTNIHGYTRTTTPPNGKREVTTTLYTFTCSDAGANRRIGTHDARYIPRLKNAAPFGRKDRAYPRFGGDGFTSEYLSLSRITAIESKPAEPVFDIEVEENHCFIADGVVSHNSTNNNIEQQALEYVGDALQPRACRLELSIEADLLLEDEAVEVEFDFRELERGDAKSRSAYYHGGILDGWLTRNEAREMEGREPIDGLDEPLRPLNMVEENEAEDLEIDQEESEPPDQEAKEQKQDGNAMRMQAMIRSSAQRLARRFSGAAANSTMSASSAVPLISEALAVSNEAAASWWAQNCNNRDEAHIAASLVRIGESV